VSGEATISARIIRRDELTGSAAIVHVKSQDPTRVQRVGETVNIGMNVPKQGWRVSSFTVLSTMPDGVFSLLVRASGDGRISDALVAGSSNEVKFWISESFSTITSASTSSPTSVLALVAGSGASILGLVSTLAPEETREIIFFGKSVDCAVIPNAVLSHLNFENTERNLGAFGLWDTTERGRASTSDLEELIGRRDTNQLIVVCGPASFCASVTEACNSLGINPEQVIIDSFGGSVTKLDSVSSRKPATAVIDLFGETVSMQWPVGETLLSSMTNAGFEAPYSCRAGICSTCQCTVLLGSAQMDVDLGLSVAEREAGLVLACQLKPVSEALAIRFSGES
jgi:3-ketosteroid 9alpha-monooxygenase subunit B